MKRTLRTSVTILTIVFLTVACAGEFEQETRDRLDRQADGYENLIRDREREWVRQMQNSMRALLFLEAERSRDEAERTSLAMKLQDRMERFGDGIRAIELRLKYKPDRDFTPFIAIWSIDGGEFQRAVAGDAAIPEAARRGLLHYEGETTFTDGADDERRIQIHMYYSNHKLERRMQAIRE